MIYLPDFISKHITHRTESLFKEDMERNHDILIREIRQKSVLVIGGAGTIGSSYIKALLTYEPAKLIVVDISENGLTELTRDLRSSAEIKVPGVYKTYPVNFADRVFEHIFADEGPFDIVANFAAHKHVRSEKDQHSIAALIENNVIHAEKLLKLLNSSTIKHFFCVSTDKAANPVNIMGASKKIMEEVIMAYSRDIKITTARFANVAFSQGSLPDGFVHRMMKRQPLSAPNDVKRYFVSPQESGEICLLACILGETGDIFFPKLNEDEMMTFSDMATAFLREQGFESVECRSEEEAKTYFRMMNDELPNSQNSKLPEASSGQAKTQNSYWPVYYFKSDTSGEKAFEEFYTPGEELDMESFASLGVIKNAPRRTIEEIRLMVHDLERTLTQPDITKANIVQVLGQLVPSFEHIETGKGLDEKM